MIRNAFVLFLVGFMAFGGSASGLSVQTIRVADSYPCATYPQLVVKQTEAFDVIVAPTSAVAFAGDYSGTLGIRLWGYIYITVVHADQTRASIMYGAAPGGQCYTYFLPPQDVTGLFKPGLNTVQVRLQAYNDWPSPGVHWGIFGETYLVATKGAIVSATA